MTDIHRRIAVFTEISVVHLSRSQSKQLCVLTGQSSSFYNRTTRNGGTMKQTQNAFSLPVRSEWLFSISFFLTRCLNSSCCFYEYRIETLKLCFYCFCFYSTVWVSSVTFTVFIFCLTSSSCSLSLVVTSGWVKCRPSGMCHWKDLVLCCCFNGAGQSTVLRNLMVFFLNKVNCPLLYLDYKHINTS